ncbi:Fic family protein [Legionella sp. CNM-4043-24]|uniref:Fic family protein n=1 Tax=Legionella sp. CNM-4043-24 TaxID=3421646 RepID=UPI00403B344C
MYSFDLSSLTEFNPALVYSFEPEAPRQYLENKDKISDSYHFIIGQHVDMLRAYQYAQSVILPYIREHGIQSITPDMLLDWIKQIHREIGRHILESEGLTAGCWSTKDIIRAHAGWDSAQDMLSFMGSIPFIQHTSEHYRRYAAHALETYGIPTADTLGFMLLLYKASFLSESILFPSQMVSLVSDSISKGGTNLALKKLCAAYNRNMLDAAQKTAIHKIMKICIPPDMLEESMQAFARKTVAGWKSAEAGDAEKLSEFLAEVFYELTEIHPFPNCNGRTATCLVNIILKSFSVPDILLRLPDEASDLSSSYVRAIKQIDQSRALLASHIKARIEASRITPWKNEALKELIETRVNIANLCFLIKKAHPSYDLCKTLSSLNQQTDWSGYVVYMSRDELLLDSASRALKQLTIIKNQLDQRRRLTLFEQPQSADCIAAVCETLGQLSGLTPWKGDRKGTAFIFEQKNGENLDAACRLLLATGLMSVEQRLLITKAPVLVCTNIQIRALLARKTDSPLAEVSMPASSSSC